MKIYNLSKFYTLNILAYFVWIGYIICPLYYYYLTYIYPIIDKVHYSSVTEIVNFFYYYAVFFIIVIALLVSSVIEWILRLTKVVTTYNELNGPKWVYTTLFWTAIVSLPVTFYIAYLLTIVIADAFYGN